MVLQNSAEGGNSIALAPSGSSQNPAPAPSWNPKWTTPARLALLQHGYEPTPLIGKRPILEGWQNLSATTEHIPAWEKSHPSASNTGILTRNNPAADIDVLDQEVGDVIHSWIKEIIPSGTPELIRVGLAPKRAILF